MSKRNDKLKAEIARRRVLEMFPLGSSAKEIADTAQVSPAAVKRIIRQEFPYGREIQELTV